MNDFQIHDSAFIDEGVHIGSGTYIWHFCHVMEGAYNVMAHDGLIRMESKTGPATIKAKGAIGINSVAGAISQTATSIFLN